MRTVAALDEMKNVGNVEGIAVAYSQLDKVQRQAMLSTLSLDKATKQLVLSRASELATGKATTVDVIKQALAYDTLTEKQKKSIGQSLIDNSVNETGLIIRKQNIDAIVAQAVELGIVTEQEREATRQKLLDTMATQANTGAVKANTKANIALIASNPATWIMVGVVAISLIVKAYNAWNVTLEEHVEKLHESKSAMDAAIAEYEEFSATIKETAQRLSELEDLEKAGTLSIVEQDELDKLRAGNKELETRYQLLKAEAEFARREHQNEFLDTFDDAKSRTTSMAYQGNGRVFYTDKLGGGDTIDLRKQTSEYIQEHAGLGFDELFELRKTEIDVINTEFATLNDELLAAYQNNDEKLIERLKKQIDTLEEAMQFQKTEIKAMSDIFSDSYDYLIESFDYDLDKINSPELRAAMETIGKWREFIATGFGASDVNESRYQSVVDTGAYDELIAKLVDLAKQGELTEAVLNGTDFTPLIDALRNLGVPIDWLIEKFNQLAAAETGVAEVQFTPMQAYLENTKPSVSADTASAALGDAMSEYNENGHVTEETLKKLEETIPGITNVLLDSKGQWTEAGKAVLAYGDNVRAATVAMYKAMIAQQQLALQSSMAEQRGPNAIEGKDYSAEQTAIQDNISALEAQLATLKGTWREAIDTSIEGIKSSTSLLTQAITDLSNGAFENWDSEFIDELLSDFPDLTDEIRAFAQGTKTANELQKDLADAAGDVYLEDLEEALDAVNEASEEYGEGSSQFEEALESALSVLPGLNAQLYDEEGNLTVVAQAALQAAAGNEEAAIAMIDAALAAAQMDLQNARAQLYSVATAAIDSAEALEVFNAKIANKEADIAALNKLKESINKDGLSLGGSGGRGGGGSSKKDVLEDYKAQKKILDHRIDMSEAAQDLMSEESDSWEAEQSKQLEIYKEYAALIQAEMERLRKLGYDNYSEELMELEKDLASVQKAMYDIAKARWEKQRDDQIEALRKQKEAAEEAHRKEMERLDAEISRNETLLGLLEAQYDLTDSLRDERYALEKELAKANSYTALSDAERDAMFTNADYAQLVGVLDEIQNEAIIAYNEYVQKIKAVGTEEAYKLDYITAEYEAQYELMAKKYEIAKQDLAVARARIALENAQKNRNVAMLINGRWTWSADPQAIEEAMDQIWDAEQEKADAESDFLHQQKVNEFEMFIASIEMQKAAAEAQHDKLMEQIDKLIEALEEMEFAFEECIEGLYDAADAIADAIAAIRAAAASGSHGGGGGWQPDDKPMTEETGKKLLTTAKESRDYNKQSATNSELAKKGYTPGRQNGAVTVVDRDSGGRVSSFSEGGVIDYTGIANVHGSKSASEVAFNAKDAAKLYDLIHNGNPIATMIENASKQLRASTAMVSPQTPAPTQSPIQYIINGLSFGESAGGLTLRELANQLTSHAPLLR